MKKIFLLLAIAAYTVSHSQNNITEEKKIESLIHIWGLLKYQHPEVSKGKVAFNNEFIKEFNTIENITGKEELNSEFINWIERFDLEKTKYKTNSDFLKTKKLFAKNADFRWIENSGFSKELVDIIIKIKNNSIFDDYYASVNSLSGMVEFKNEKGYDNFNPDIKSNRILFLASFWNIMRYWNVNIYLTDTPWANVLTEMIPEFISNDKIKYELAKDRLFSKLNDSHSNYNSSYLFKDSSTRFSMYGGKIINDTLIVKRLFNKDLALKDNVELGDLIYTINGKNLKEYYSDKFSDRISASNENYLKSALEKYYLLSGNSDSIKIGLLKKDKSINDKYIRRYKSSDYKYEPVSSENSKKEQWLKLADDIGYINLENINKSELNKAFKAFEKTRGIVIDLRNYPRNLTSSDVPDYLYPEKKIFIKVLAPFLPSYGEYDSQATLKAISNPFSAGKNNKNYYKGKVILLVDRTTGSMAEFFGMAIQQSENCTTIGEKTFGAVMNRNRVILIDKTTIDFTGMGAFYPNDKEVQRNGLKIDFEIKENAINYNPDSYIEEAIRIIQQK